jgi:hypothetical protein
MIYVLSASNLLLGHDPPVIECLYLSLHSFEHLLLLPIDLSLLLQHLLSLHQALRDTLHLP